MTLLLGRQCTAVTWLGPRAEKKDDKQAAKVLIKNQKVNTILEKRIGQVLMSASSVPSADV